jgi:hypothetical protein
MKFLKLKLERTSKLAKTFRMVQKVYFYIPHYQRLQKNDLELPKNKNKVISFQRKPASGFLV